VFATQRIAKLLRVGTTQATEAIAVGKLPLDTLEDLLRLGRAERLLEHILGELHTTGGEGVDALQIHHVWVGDWQRGIGAERNMLVFSMPSRLDPQLAPEGHQVLHAYSPANEPWELWRDLEPGSAAYEALKTELAAAKVKEVSVFSLRFAPESIDPPFIDRRRTSNSRRVTNCRRL
jgi:phytoene dehydrogenase-like protein